MPPINVRPTSKARTDNQLAPAGVYYPSARVFFQVIFDGFADDARDSEPFMFWTTPKEVRVLRNGYEQADSWSVTFDALDLPVDPQLIRAGAAEIYLYQVSERLAEPRIVKHEQSFVEKIGEAAAKALALATRRPPLDLRPTVAGLFDDASLKMNSDGKWVTITGQDYTDFLIKKQWKPLANGHARRVPTGKRLDIILAEILEEADEEGRLRLVVENMDPTRLPVVGRNETRSNQRGIPVKSETSYWEVMYKLATRHGALLFVRGQDVVLSRDKNITDQFDPRIKRLAWGKNIESVDLSRRLAKVAAPTIVLRSYDPKTRQTIEVDFPPNAFARLKTDSVFGQRGKHTEVKVSGGGKTKRGKDRKVSIKKSEEYQIIPIYGITDRATLLEAAELRYNRIAREEREMTLVTRDLKDLDGDDLLTLSAGDAVSLDFSEFNKETVIMDPRVSKEVKMATLRGRGFSPDVAAVIVKHADKLQFLSRPMRVRECSFDYTSDDGVRVELVLQDFIVVNGRRDVDTKPGKRDSRDNRLGGKGFTKVREDANRRQFP